MRSRNLGTKHAAPLRLSLVFLVHNAHLMSSLRLVLWLSLLESHAANTVLLLLSATAVKGNKKAAVHIDTPEKENVPSPAVAPRKEMIRPHQQDKLPPQHSNIIFSKVSILAEIVMIFEDRTPRDSVTRRRMLLE